MILLQFLVQIAYAASQEKLKNRSINYFRHHSYILWIQTIMENIWRQAPNPLNLWTSMVMQTLKYFHFIFGHKNLNKILYQPLNILTTLKIDRTSIWKLYPDLKFKHRFYVIIHLHLLVRSLWTCWIQDWEWITFGFNFYKNANLLCKFDQSFVS